MSIRTRWALSVVAAGAPLVAVAWTYAVWHQRLPARMATHWSGNPNGSPDGFSSTDGSAGWISGLCLLALVVAGVAATLSRRNPPVARAAVVAAASAGGLLGGLWIAVSTAALAAVDPLQAQLGPRLLWLLALGWGLLPLALLRGLPTARPSSSHHPEPMVLAPDQRVMWVQVLRSRLLAGVLVFSLVVTVVLAVVVDPWLWAYSVLPVAALSLVFAQVRVSVDQHGVRVVSGLLRLPLKRIALPSIAGVSTQKIEPMQWGGWGYRVLPGRSALVLRSGPGLVLDLDDGRQFAVTVDDPDTPARLLTGLLARH